MATKYRGSFPHPGPAREAVPANRSVALGSGTAVSRHTSVKMARAAHERHGKQQGWDKSRVPHS